MFVANEVLQGCLIHVRRLCESASGSLTGVGEGDSAVSLVNLDRQKTLTLEEFKQEQFSQGKIARDQLKTLREKIIEIVWESCAVSRGGLVFMFIATVKWVIFAGFYFRYIHDLLMEREFNTPQIILSNFEIRENLTPRK